MNTPNPLVPQGSQLEQKSNARSRVKLAVFFVLTIHVVGLMALLVQGCRPEEQEVPETVIAPEVPVFEPIPVPSADTNDPLLQPVAEMPTAEGGPVMTYTPPPDTAPRATEAPVYESTTSQQYAIQKGDTYYSIGKQFGVSMQALKDANPGVQPTRLQVGKTINIPPPAPVVPEVVAPVLDGELIYTVVSGDNLSKIASKYGTTWQEIKKLNGLTTTQIKVGDKLRIPVSKAPAGGTPGSGF